MAVSLVTDVGKVTAFWTGLKAGAAWLVGTTANHPQLQRKSTVIRRMASDLGQEPLSEGDLGAMI